MRIEFYKCNSDPENLTKDIWLLEDPILGVIGEYDGFLREDSPITDPVFTIETIDSGEEFPWARINYFHIPSWGRYYYITDITVIRTHLYQITGHVDVLMSFRTELGNCSGIVYRNENNWNMYLDDGSLKVFSNPIIQRFEFPQGFITQQYMLALAGSGLVNNDG